MILEPEEFHGWKSNTKFNCKHYRIIISVEPISHESCEDIWLESDETILSFPKSIWVSLDSGTGFPSCVWGYKGFFAGKLLIKDLQGGCTCSFISTCCCHLTYNWGQVSVCFRESGAEYYYLWIWKWVLMVRGACQTTVHAVIKSQTWLSD